MPTATKPDRRRITELRTQLQAKAKEIADISDAFKIEDNGGVVVSTEQRDAYVKAISEAEEIKGLLDAEERVSYIEDYLAAPEGTPAAGADAAAAAHHGMARKTLAQLWMESDAYSDMKDSDWRRFGQVFSAKDANIHAFPQPERKDTFSGMAGTVPINPMGTPQDLGFVQRQLRPGRVRDLFPAESTTANMLYGVRETGFINRAAAVQQRTAANGGPATGADTDVYGLKPRSDLTLGVVTYPISTIAHLMYVHRETLADEPRMQALIDRDMVDGIKMQEDWQILYGDGLNGNLTGIVNTPGVQTYTGQASDPRTAQIRRAITRVTLAYFQPTGCVLHPLDWEDFELEQTTDGHYRLVMNVAIGAQQTLWRLNVVDTPAINEGQAMIGAFGLGSKIWDREQVNIQVSTENRDLFERNAVTVRCEERIALEVPRPEAHCLVTLTNPA